MQNNSKTIGILGMGVLVVGVLAYLLLGGDTSTTVNPAVTETPASDTSTVEPVTNTTENEDKSLATTTLSVEEEASVKVEEESVPAVVVPTKPVVTTQPPVVVDPAPVTPVAVGISMSAVATHNNANSCWSAIDGKVYDLTTYIPKHPGGKSEILAICGKDGSSLFSGQHEGQSKPERILAGYYVDVVAK